MAPIPPPDLTLVAQPHVLTIAGSDSGGGAGIQADLKTISAFGCYGSSVITALTAQNTLGVQDVMAVPPAFVVKQLDSLFADDLRPDAIKFGMLSSAETISALAAFFRDLPSPEAETKVSRPYLVLDPVMISTSGHTLLPTAASAALISDLLPLVDLVTPNLPEALVLSATASSAEEAPLASDIPTTLDGMLALAEAVRSATGAPSVLLKGGHTALSSEHVASEAKRRGLPVHWAGEGSVDSSVNNLNGTATANGHDEEDVDADDAFDTHVLTNWRVAHSLASSDSIVVDILLAPEHTHIFAAPKADTTSTHGTGCTLSAALACTYALEGSESRRTLMQYGDVIDENGGLEGVGAESAIKSRDGKLEEPIGSRSISPESVRQAIEYVQGAIAAAVPRGRGQGPLDHGYMSLSRIVPLPTPQNPTPFTTHLLSSARTTWREYVHHPFVVQIGEGTLPLDSFRHYLQQDYHYLRHYARAHALVGTKCTTFPLISHFSRIALNVAGEASYHVEFCAKYGISPADLAATPESSACVAYSRYILDVAAAGDVLEGVVALAACLVGYGEVGLWLQARAEREAKRHVGGTEASEKVANPYQSWIDVYAGDEFLSHVRDGISLLERLVARDPPGPEKMARLEEIWRNVVRFEGDFWSMGLNKSF